MKFYEIIQRRFLINKVERKMQIYDDINFSSKKRRLCEGD